MKELDLVVLTRDFAEYGLLRGDIGTIVHCYSDSEGFEVEFVTADGETIAVLTLTLADIRPRERKEILQTRQLAPSAA
ncbi:MAG: DUF4926 domain-containing protein [Anaerolineales bacterium]|nr:DUF4926 domain-containing protein [Anaerolineales bacterium]